jgi:GxxExxY protein
MDEQRAYEENKTTAHHGDTENHGARTDRSTDIHTQLNGYSVLNLILMLCHRVLRCLVERVVGLIEHQTNPISEKVIGAAIEVHRQLGPGLLESSYHGCLCRELELRGIPHASEVPLPLEYKGVQIEKGYVIDLLIEDAVIVEIKAVEKLLPIHASQLMTYMQIKRASAGLLINFNVQTLFHGLKRILR